VHGGEVLHSLAYGRAVSRVSYNVLTNYQEGDSEVKYIARVQCFVKVCAPEGLSSQPLRLAISDLFTVTCAAAAAGTIYVSPSYPEQPTHSAYAVSFSQDCMLNKHAIARAGSAAYFMPYSNMSGASRAD
jgi:hypothetical protein